MKVTKTMLKILGGGFAVFMVMAVVEEWQVFLPLVGTRVEPSAMVSDDERQAAEETVGELLSLMTHLYTSNGDARFAERLPATGPVVDEMLAEIAYLQHNLRTQDPKLMRLEFLTVEPSGTDRWRVLTREFWVVRTFSSVHRGLAEATHSSVLQVEYFLVKDGQRLRVEAWSHVRRGGDEPTPASVTERASASSPAD